MSPRAVEKRARPGNELGPADNEPAIDLSGVGSPVERSEEHSEDSAQQ